MGCDNISVALTGASGIIYGIKLLDAINKLNINIKGIIYSKGSIEVAKAEEGISEEDFIKILRKFGEIYDEDNFNSPLASSSNISKCMIICPASMKTVGLIANGIPMNLVSRAALAHLRLKRPLIIAFRETPLGTAELTNLLKISRYGGIIMPLSPGFYSNKSNIDDMINFMIGKILDVLNIQNNFYRRWDPKSSSLEDS
ncbi:MAG: aromatic acid decarboxylase [Caldisphaera sp.]|jgi:4-hydroxy-3-polyprenylbenzoate decarboxylase|nr:MAG: aromatic acid decarboxylase [Caldisphaera sp.]PMP89133.1 MAG: aromatic acid decarboxylase [Caldisphaera sp.]